VKLKHQKKTMSQPHEIPSRSHSVQHRKPSHALSYVNADRDLVESFLMD
jgi:hypothetical protein